MSQLTTKQFFSQDSVKNKFTELVGAKAPQFITSIMSAVNSNNLLQNASYESIYQCAIMGAILDLPINANLGFAYIVPYKGQAQFQIGYKGFIQLAQRSGQFKTISASPIYAGQILKNDPLTGFEFDFSVAQSGEPVGYCAYFKLLNGYEQYVYLTKEQVTAHAKKFSQTFKKGFGVWQDNFDAMALKTVLKMILSKYAPLSIDMQKAVQADQAVIKNAEEADFEFVDNSKEVVAEKPKLTKNHPSFEAIKAQIQTGEKSWDQVTEKFEIDEETEKDLLQ